MKILIASRNRGKIAELKDLLGQYITDTELELVSLDDVGMTGEIEENGSTFEENALIKANAGAAFSGLITIADDSGLAVKALDGAPGVYSARYAGEGHNDAANNAKLLDALRGVGDREAAFICAMACVFPADSPLTGDGTPILVKGACVGEILCAERGEGGFGYDPLFWYDEFGKTFAELSIEEKNAISHRGRAVAKLGEALSERIKAYKEIIWRKYGL